MVDTQLLEKYIEKSGMKKNFICDKLGISAQAFYKKMKNEIPFKSSETWAIAYWLHLSSNECTDIFFANEV